MKQRVQDPNDSSTFGNSLQLRVDGAIGAMSVSPNGRDAVLAGRRGLFIIDLDDPFTTPRWLHHITSWEVADVQWSPHNAKPSWCISTSNQKALLWDLARPSDNAILNVLHRHTRAITDINFHPHNPELLATCSIDTFMLCWDMRSPRKPVQQWAEWRAGATQVKWNHDNEYQIASSHDNNFYLWDSRKGALPVLKVSKAHRGKINGLDFSDGSANLITCSNDNTVKLWNLNSQAITDYTADFFDGATDVSALSPTVVINTDFPVSRARALPFGADKACGIMPLRGGQDAIHIVNYDQAYHKALETNETQHIDGEGIHTFKGHKGPMKDFLWRKKHEKYDGFQTKNNWKDYQLVTWSSQDYDLKLWPHEEQLYKQVNYNPSYNKLLSAFKNEEIDGETRTASASVTPDLSDTEGPESVAYTYDTYCIEPAVSVEDLIKKNNGEVLSSMTSFQISEKHRKNNYTANQLNHLDWISGVRMGRARNDSQRKDSTNSFEGEDGPSNLGEEVSIVGHKFPKVRFEKISVSTGELVISLKGPVPVIESPPETKLPTTDIKDDVSVNDKDTLKDGEKGGSISGKDSDPKTTSSNVSSTAITTTANVSTIVTEEAQDQELIFIRLEINFPTGYPYLNDVQLDVPQSKKLNRLQKLNLIQFEIEETHELTGPLKSEMLSNLNCISQFYSNKYQRFCLEPCLRYLMGDKLDLNDELMIERSGEDEVLPGDVEIGNEGWADDLINQQPDYEPEMNDSEEDIEYVDLIPAYDEENDVDNSGIFDEDGNVASPEAIEDKNASAKMTFFDSTPVPKGCGAIWSPSGHLVCFFIPKNNEEESKSYQKFNIFKFTDGGFSLNTHNNHHHHHHHKISNEHNSVDSEVESGSDSSSITSELNGESDTASDDSFNNDWDEILQDDALERARIPGLFKTSVGLGNRYIGRGDKTSRFTSHGGTTSNYKSSNPGEVSSKKKRETKNKNIVGIFDFRHLLPDKYDLACEYRVLGDSPEKLARYNSEVALKYGLNEISDVWKILEMVLVKEVQYDEINPLLPTHFKIQAAKEEVINQLLTNTSIAKRFVNKPKYRFFWGTHPFGQAWLIKEIFEFFERKGNIQMLAMLSCILYENTDNMKRSSAALFNVPINTPYQVLPPAPSVVAMRKLNDIRSYSVSQDQLAYSLNDDSKFQDYLGSQHRNSSHLVQRNINVPYAKSVSSSLEMSLNGSPERFSYLKKNITPNNSHNSELSPISDIREVTKGNNHKVKAKKGIENNSKKKTQLVVSSKSKYPSRNRLRAPPSVTIEMQNSDELDLFDDVYSLPLLHSQNSDKIKSYREQYADMLFVWGLPISRIKILKFNYPENEITPRDSPFSIHACHFGLRSKRIQYSTQICVNAVTSVATARSNVWNTSKRNVLKYCVLCNLVVAKNLVVCTNCEHILHTDCASEWWGIAEGMECPSGCGCTCLEHKI